MLDDLTGEKLPFKKLKTRVSINEQQFRAALELMLESNDTLNDEYQDTVWKCLGAIYPTRTQGEEMIDALNAAKNEQRKADAHFLERLATQISNNIAVYDDIVALRDKARARDKGAYLDYEEVHATISTWIEEGRRFDSRLAVQIFEHTGIWGKNVERLHYLLLHGEKVHLKKGNLDISRQYGDAADRITYRPQPAASD